MTINLILVDELGTDLIAETIDRAMQEVLGDNLDNYIEFRLSALKDRHPEARFIYREDVKSPSELKCEAYERAYEENLKWAEEHPEEIDGWDPEEWADEQTRYEFDNINPYFGGW